MITIVLCVMDVQAQAFQRPMFFAARGVGVRMVADEVNRAAQDNLLYMHPEDFRVFELGSWDDKSGLFQCHPQPLLVVDCGALKASAPR